MASNYRMKYNVDLVFCIDATGSMKDALNMVKRNAMTLHQDLVRALAKKDKEINQLRIRVVAFRDYYADGADAMLTTDFFTLPQDTDLFQRAVASLSPFGGGDDPEDGLEALAIAIRSPWWREEGAKTRQVIVVWTDAPTHEIGTNAKMPGYPQWLPKSFDELTSWWANETNEPGSYMSYNAERLVIYAPDVPYWKTISDNWENVVHFPSVAGGGLGEMDYDEILDTIANSVAVGGMQ